ncbi:acyl-CoA dehydrogenase family protein [Paraburkholderia sp. IW21]|uniref:acyl-CoA dehydrogenase family protein n=1 Tax=Paraburkholderia sp. IW21 TaxID=3242488 RepID=UPI0035217F38
MTDDIFAESFERLLGGVCTPAIVREIEAGAAPGPLWSALAEAGFADLLVSEEGGGAGLSLHAAAPLIEACGRHALPVPLAYTVLARAALERAGANQVDGPVTIADKPAHAVRDGIRCAHVPFGAVSEWLVVTHDGACALWPAKAAKIEHDGIHGSLDASFLWPSVPADAIGLEHADWRAVGAATTALMMAGAMERLLDMTIAYANDRKQFGKPIGRFQAVQQQISLFAERTFATRMASRIACPATRIPLDRHAVAVAKGYASAAAIEITAIAHAVHGAIGITAEHDLNLYTRRLHAWRRAFGAETAWHAELGRAWLLDASSALDFTRAHLAPSIA